MIYDDVPVKNDDFHSKRIEQCSESLSHFIMITGFIGIPLLDYCNPQYIKGSFSSTN